MPRECACVRIEPICTTLSADSRRRACDRRVAADFESGTRPPCIFGCGENNKGPRTTPSRNRRDERVTPYLRRLTEASKKLGRVRLICREDQCPAAKSRLYCPTVQG